MRWQSRAKRLNGLIACTRCLFNSYEHTREPPHTVALKRLFCFEYYGLHKHGTSKPTALGSTNMRFGVEQHVRTQNYTV